LLRATGLSGAMAERFRGTPPHQVPARHCRSRPAEEICDVTATRLLLLAAAAASALSLPLAARAADNEFAAPLTDFAKGQLRDLAENPVLIDAVRAQNAASSGYDQARIDALDKQWRDEVDATDKPLIDATLGTDASKFLAGEMEKSAGLITEIFATDAKGLDVAQASLTSDYWQGDEDKFTKSFGAGADAIFISDVEQDESTQTYQSQVSITITDPATGAPIGSITAGIDVGKL
jgi:hypothetical protein